jgi:amino acid permease
MCLTGSTFATILRLSCCAVAMTSYPLCLVPASDMMSSIGNYEGTTRSIPLRVGLVVVCTTIALLIPDFGLMVSIIGNFSVSMVSFVLPSAMALACAHHADYQRLPSDVNTKSSFRTSLYYVDLVLLVVGILTCACTTFLTLSSAFATTPPGVVPLPPLTPPSKMRTH